jgi:hypothetical protein
MQQQQIYQMRAAYLLFVLFMILFFNTAVIKKISNKGKRSVFDIMTNVEHNLAQHVTKLSLLKNDMKEIKYHDLKNIFNMSKKEKKHSKIKHKQRKKDIKNHFLDGSRAKHKSKPNQSKKENVIMNFYFLTKLSE